MIIIKGFRDRRGNRRDIIFGGISIYVIRMSFKDSVFLIGYGIDNIRYYFHIHYLSFWKFKKQISKKLLYKLFDKKTVSNIFREKIVALIVENEDILINQGYRILRNQFIKL